MRLKEILLIGCSCLAGVAWGGAVDLQVRSMAASCTTCHVPRNSGPGGIESLEGRAQEDLLRQLTDFRSGSRPATLMHQLSKGYSLEQLEQLAHYFSTQKPGISTP